jgi:hypothetical protein
LSTDFFTGFKRGFKLFSRRKTLKPTHREKFSCFHAFADIFRKLKYLFSSPFAREERETALLYARVKKAFDQSPLAKIDLGTLAEEIALSALEESGHAPSPALFDAVYLTAVHLILEDGLLELPTVDFSKRLSLEKALALRKLLAHKEYFLRDAERSLARWRELTRNTLAGMLDYLPATPVSENENAAFSIGLVELINAPAEVMDRLFITTLTRSGEDAKLFGGDLRTRLEQNLKRASGAESDDPDSLKNPVLPSQARGKTPAELSEMYLAGTPFESFFNLEVPFTLPFDARFEHTHIVGGSGHGKTQLLQLLIASDLDEQRGLCVIDSQGDLFKNIAHLRLPREKVILIDPNDLEYPVALNMFDIRLDAYSGVEREKILNGTIALYEYIFGALLGAELTQKQGIIFKYLARLMISIPGATIHTLCDLMEHGERFKGYMQQLEGTPRRFFETQFFEKSFVQTKKQIAYRLYGLLGEPTFERMFSHRRNKVDLFEAMNNGKIVLIHTAKDLLKKDGCQILGRFFIAMIAQAALQRATLSPEERRPFFVYIDEAYDYFDENIEDLLNQARKYKVGLILAHQNLDQLPQKLEATLMASASIKFVGGVNSSDARAFAKEMRCDADFLQSMRRYPDHTEFACFIRNHTPKAVRLSVPFGVMEDLPKASEEDYQILLGENRERYGEPRAEAPVEVVAKVPEPISEIPTIGEAASLAETAPVPQPQKPPEVPKPVEISVPEPPKPKPERKPRPRREEPVLLGRGGAKHKYFQQLIKRFAEEQGFRASIERPILGGAGSVDVSLEREDRRIACEISITTPADHELGNVTKCLKEDYDTVILLSADAKHMRELKDYIEPQLESQDREKVLFFLPEEFIGYLDQQEAEAVGSEKTIKGYKVRVKYTALEDEERKSRRQAIAKVILQSMKRMN